MMNALVTVAFALGPLPVGDEAEFVGDTEAAARLAEVVRSCENVGMSGAVLAARDGEVWIAIGVGSADLEGEQPNTANTLFEIASATKQFTGAAICKLAEKGKLELDDSIDEHLPGVPDNCKAITIRHLLQHTSGIPKENTGARGSDLRAAVATYLEGGPTSEPGTVHAYWNGGYALLAGIVAETSGDSFPDYCKSQLFAKAKMKLTCFNGDDPPRKAVVAVGSSPSGPPRSALEHPYGEYGYQYLGMGGAVLNVWELWRWDRALAGKKLFKPKTKELLFEPGLEGYAAGWRIHESGGRPVQSHSGSVRGFVCDVRRYPEDDGCLFVLCNRSSANVHGISRLLEGALFGEDVASPPGPLDEEVRGIVAGEYEDSEGRLLVVETLGASTPAKIHWGGSEAAGPTTRGFLGGAAEGAVFFDWRESLPSEIVLGEDGSVSAIRIGEMEYRRR